MANHSYMSITGNRQGLISAGCSDTNSIGNKCGANNIHEGLANIYYDPENPAVVGPIRKIYQFLAGDSSHGNIAYFGVDMGLSIFSILQPVRKPDSVELFIRDPMNYERDYKRMGKISLAFEALIDGITIRNIDNEVTQQTNNKNHRPPLNSFPDIKYP